VNHQAEPSMLLERLTQAVRRLSWQARQQQDYLVELGVAGLADELALEFDDAFRPVRQLLDVLQVATPAQVALVALDELLDEMSESEADEIWTWAALHHSVEWGQVRALASRTLQLLPKA
jgi:hypothetical protein